jgi:hypothetical protein
LKTRQIIFSLLLVATCFKVKAQSTDMSNGISVGINISVGDFSSTHLIGIGVEYSPLRHTFQLLKLKHLAFTYNGGVAYYFGKKEIVSNNPYKYPGYIFIHAFGGLLYNPVKKTSITLSAGPALRIYNSLIRFNIGSKLELSYFINDKIAIGPGIIFMKESGTNPLWAASLKATIAF